MKLPKSVKVGGLRYLIKLVKDELDGNAGALCDKEHQTIAIEVGAIATAQRHKLLHEIIHAINFELDEKETEFWTVLFEQLLMDNPEFTRLFLKNGG